MLEAGDESFIDLKSCQFMTEADRERRYSVFALLPSTPVG